MQNKSQHREYDNWKTEKQFNEEGIKVLDKKKGVNLWAYQRKGIWSTYYSPDNTAPMSEEEKLQYQEIQKERRRENSRKAYARKKEKEKLKEEELKALYELRKKWHTVEGWLQEGKRVKDIKDYKTGEWLKEDLCLDYEKFEKYFYYIDNVENLKPNNEETQEKERLRFKELLEIEHQERLEKLRKNPFNIEQFEKAKKFYITPEEGLKQNKILVSIYGYLMGYHCNLTREDEGPFIPNYFYVNKLCFRDFKNEKEKEEYTKLITPYFPITEDNYKKLKYIIKEFNSEEEIKENNIFVSNNF